MDPKTTPGALVSHTLEKYRILSHFPFLFQNGDVPQTLLIMYPNDISNCSVHRQSYQQNHPKIHQKIIQNP